MRFIRFLVIVSVFCVCNPRRVSGMDKYSILMSFTAISQGNTYKYDAEVALHYTFPLFGWYNSTFDVGRSTRGKERLRSFLTKPLTYLERVRQVLLNQGSRLSVRYDCFLGQLNFRCFIIQYRDEEVIIKATLSCELRTSMKNYGACVPKSVFTRGDGKRLLNLLMDGDAVKPETEAFPDLLYDLSVIQHNLLRDSRPEELRVVAYVNSEKTMITCQVKSGLEVHFRIRCETVGSVPSFDDGRMEYLISSGSRSERYRTVEARATVKLNSTVVTTARCTVESSLGWIAIFELTWTPGMNIIGGRGLTMSLKSRTDPDIEYTVPNTRAYEDNLYKEAPYIYDSYKRYLGLTLGNLVSVIVFSILFLLFIGTIVVVWKKNISFNAFTCIAHGIRPQTRMSIRTTAHQETKSKNDIEMTPKVTFETPETRRL